ncbi:MAG: hypothetical protein COA86_10805 [Kangiella sp.]|nr:MAG: hypothetical protein COA86_10805 [Kangiella sp.]
MSKSKISIALVIILGVVVYYFSPMFGDNRVINQLVERNMVARGGEDAWSKVKSLRLSGRMEIGQSTHVPYILDQQRTQKMCIEFTFDQQKTLQCSDGKQGWKVVPFRGRNNAELLTDKEFNEVADAGDLYGLLSQEVSSSIDYLGLEKISDKDTHKLRITLPKGSIKFLYIDDETALEVKLETTRLVGGKERTVTTLYSEWKDTDGLLISHRQDTQTDGDENSYFMTVESVEVNPTFNSIRFELPASLSTK